MGSFSLKRRKRVAGRDATESYKFVEDGKLLLTEYKSTRARSNQ